jgi:(p)ppGpp synthase/HD superfamily hydrolase
MEKGMKYITLHATEFAALAHAGQERKYTGHPYVWHPISVAIKVASVTDDPEMIAAALLHDTVEDTDATHEDIANRFGARVATLVYELTNISVLDDGNRATRRAIDKAFMATASPDAMTIRLADIADNLKDVQIAPGGFAKLYMGEKEDMIEVLGAGDPTLMAEVKTIIANFKNNR